MRTTTAGTADRRPLHRRLGDDQGPSAGIRRRELTAALATAAVVGQLLFAQPTLFAAAILIAVGRMSRWRPHWLAVTTAGTIVWLFAIGPAPAVAGFAAVSQRLATSVVAAAMHPRLLDHPGGLAEVGARLPGALPVALFAACGEAWLALWLAWWRPGARLHSQWLWRPGLVAAVRRRTSAAALAAGHTATSYGCAVGVATGTGKLADFNWADAEHGVLLAGPDLDLVGLAIACAALRRRKTVLIFECTAPTARSCAYVGSAGVVERVGNLARWLGVPVSFGGDTSLAASIGRAIRCRETMLIKTEPANADRSVADLAAVLAGLRDRGLRADCLTWISGVECTDLAILADLLALGPLTGTVVVLSITSSADAARLASVAGVVAISQPVSIDLKLALAARLRDCGGSDAFHAAQPLDLTPPGLGEATMFAFPPGSDGPPPTVTSCQIVPITPDRRI